MTTDPLRHLRGRGDEDIDQVFEMVGKRAAAIMRAEHGLSVGGAADIVVLDAAD
ncbi:hypothetical protein ABCW43_26155 [Neorhizobium sp. IRAMC:178]|uniref:hypothetical protein n=1 Tax=Neorhizobium tunisiense TaxID=3144793 RepID=UPI0031F6A438